MKIEGYEHFCTVGDLKKFLEKHQLPDDAKILIQRVEDNYFEDGKISPISTAWKTIKKEGHIYNHYLAINQRVISGEMKEDYPEMTEEELQAYITPDEILEKIKEQYIVAWCPVKYDNDDNLYFDAHY